MLVTCFAIGLLVAGRCRATAGPSRSSVEPAVPRPATCRRAASASWGRRIEWPATATARLTGHQHRARIAPFEHHSTQIQPQAGFLLLCTWHDWQCVTSSGRICFSKYSAASGAIAGVSAHTLAELNTATTIEKMKAEVRETQVMPQLPKNTEATTIPTLHHNLEIDRGGRCVVGEMVHRDGKSCRLGIITPRREAAKWPRNSG